MATAIKHLLITMGALTLLDLIGVIIIDVVITLKEKRKRND